MRRALAVAAVTVAFCGPSFVAARAQQQTRHESGAVTRFIGTWRLVSIQGDSASRVKNRGPHPTGLIYYDGTGHMAAQVRVRRRRPPDPFAG